MKTILSLAVVCALVTSGHAAAETEDAHENWAINVVHENDRVDAGHDRNYTSGVMIAATSPPIRMDRGTPLWDAVQSATQISGEELEARREFSISSQMYTPQDLQRIPSDPNDRPFAGIGLLSAGFLATDGHGRLDTFSLSVGAVGSASRADDMQTWLHDEIDGVMPDGWRDQIPNRFIANLAYQKTRIFYEDELGLPYELFYHWGGMLGSYQTNLNVGASFRIGWNAPDDFGVPRVAPSVPSSGYFEPRRDKLAGLYLLAGVQQRYVFYDVTLDEGPSHRAPTIDSNEWVGDAQIGIVGYLGPLHVGYTQVWRGRQFRSQPHEDSFGSWAIGLRTCLCRSSPFPPPWR